MNSVSLKKVNDTMVCLLEPARYHPNRWARSVRMWYMIPSSFCKKTSNCVCATFTPFFRQPFNKQVIPSCSSFAVYVFVVKKRYSIRNALQRDLDVCDLSSFERHWPCCHIWLNCLNIKSNFGSLVRDARWCRELFNCDSHTTLLPPVLALARLFARFGLAPDQSWSSINTVSPSCLVGNTMVSVTCIL